MDSSVLYLLLRSLVALTLLVSKLNCLLKISHMALPCCPFALSVSTVNRSRNLYSRLCGCWICRVQRCCCVACSVHCPILVRVCFFFFFSIDIARIVKSDYQHQDNAYYSQVACFEELKEEREKSCVTHRSLTDAEWSIRFVALIFSVQPMTFCCCDSHLRVW